MKVSWMTPTYGMWYDRGTAHAFVPGTAPKADGRFGADHTTVCGYSHGRWSDPVFDRRLGYDEKCRKCEKLSGMTHEEYIVTKVMGT